MSNEERNRDEQPKPGPKDASKKSSDEASGDEGRARRDEVAPNPIIELLLEDR